MNWEAMVPGVAGRDLIAFIPAVLFLMIPVIAILTAHQRKMAELIHGKSGSKQQQQDDLAEEVRRLSQLIHQQSMAIESLSLELRQRQHQSSLEGRFGETQIVK